MLAAAVVAVLLLGGLAANLARNQARARTAIEQEFERRATLAASLTSSALRGTIVQYGAIFGGPREGLPEALRDAQASQPGAQAAVLDAAGRPLARFPADRSVARLVATPTVRRALAGEFALSSLTPAAGRPGGFDLTIAAPFVSPSGRRVAVEVLDAGFISAFATAYLTSAPAIRGGQAYLVDANGRVISSSSGGGLGSAPADEALRSALRHSDSGAYGSDRHFASASIAGTPWRAVLSAPRSRLFAPVSGATVRTPWLLYAAFVAALVALGAVGVATTRKSTQLASAEERERAAQRLAHERLHDALTGLPNRALLQDRADQALALADRGDRTLAVLFVDVDRFKRINDSLGHASGDELLTMLAARLRSLLDAGDTVSRFGADEFVLLCGQLAGADDARRIAEAIMTALELPFQLGRRNVHVTCCIGIAVHPQAGGGVDAAALVRNAEAALRSAKVAGCARMCVFDPRLHDEALARLDMEVALRTAIAAEELLVHYQPIVGLPNGDLRGVEALVRWQRPEIGLVPPMDFIPLAEESGLISELGRWVLDRAMRDAAGWKAAGLVGDDFVLSVNASAHQLTSGELPATVSGLLAGWALEPAQLWLEITETAVVSDPQVGHAQIRALSALGVRVAIDDFGVGQSSLDQLVHSLPVEILKLDRSFTAHLSDWRERAVVAAIAPMAESLQMIAIAEGVETTVQADELAQLGYPLAQGFLFGRPMDCEAITQRLRGSAMAVAD